GRTACPHGVICRLWVATGSLFLTPRYAGVLFQSLGTISRSGFNFASAMQISTIGIDLAKTVFRIHGVDGEGKTRCSSGRKIIGFPCLSLHERSALAPQRMKKLFSLGRVIMA